MTDKQIITHTNDLAREFYEMQGCVVKPGYKFYLATHPQEVLCWNLAAKAMEYISNTDVENALAECNIVRPDIKDLFDIAR